MLTAYTNVLIYFYIIFSFYLKEFQGPFLHFLNRATLVVLFVSFIFSGSKSALLSVVFVFYSVQFYFSSIFPEKVAQADRKFKGLLPLVLILGVIGAFFTLGIQRKVTDGFEIAGLLAERMVATGDVFFMAYPHGVIEKVKQKTDIFTATFVDFLAMTRMISSSEAPEPIGFALTAYHYGPMPFGPNPRHNILGYLYLGDYAFAYSFVLGCIIGLFRNNRLVCFKRGYLFRLIHFLFFVQVRTIWSDPPLAVAHINGILFFLLPPLLFSLILSHITLKYNRQPKFFLSKPRSVI
ncbi:MAG: hypothetical protein CVV41_20055 [Candidatus Riflebacteria bacterium HGW-Riflebacteria-1]|nr:MAG: hypothetical protein CVV41_20055 [Candidatus Riflebacteria bacterium HGW-Riflebacteria-1]